jgi:proteasome lid subunit RPN8/RPN11
MQKGEMPKQTYRLMKQPLRKLINQAAKVSRNNGREICGLLIDNGHFLECLQVENTITHGGSFAFNMKDTNNIEKAAALLGHSIVGTFHSHPFSLAQPGDTDISEIVGPALMLIIDCLNKEERLWRIVREKAREVQFELL